MRSRCSRCAARCFCICAWGGADAYTFALVPKSTNNPFYDQALAGCKKAEAELKGAIKCLYIGPGEHGGGDEQAQIVGDLIAKKVEELVSPANAAAIAAALQGAKGANIPVVTFDSDLLEKDKGLRAAYIGTHNYDIGVNLAKQVMEVKPKGGTVCIQSGGAAAANHNERMQGIRDTLAGKKSAEAPGERLTGQNGWTEVAGCPQYTNDDFPLAMQIRGSPEQGSQPRRLHSDRRLRRVPARRLQETRWAKYKDRIASGKIAVAVADTLPMQLDDLRAGLATGNVGQRPFDMGYKVMYALKDVKDGKAPPPDPTYTGLDLCTPQNVDTCIGGGK